MQIYISYTNIYEKMSFVYYKGKVDDIDLTISDKYIQYGSDIIPTHSLSFISIRRARVNWWIPVLFLISAIVFAIIGDETLDIVALFLFGIGLALLIIAIIKSKYRFFKFVSHSRDSICLRWRQGNNEPLFDAVFKLLENDRLPIVTDNRDNHLSYMPK